MGVVSLDGVPINEGGMSAESHRLGDSRSRAARQAGSILSSRRRPTGTQATLITRAVDTGPAGENDPMRPLATIVAQGRRARAAFGAACFTCATGAANFRVAGRRQTGARTETLLLREALRSEQSQQPDGLHGDRRWPGAGSIRSAVAVPNITVQQGDVEDWVIENRSQELHAFHIHQIHFLLIGWNGVPVDEPFLRDTVNVPYWDGASPVYPSVKLRMDFRDPNTVGTFVYHCHLLEHEDGGMMGTIRVEPRSSQAPSQALAEGSTVLEACPL